MDKVIPPPEGVVVALCTGHRCAALMREDAGALADAIAGSSGGVLISASCLQHCAQGAVAAIAIRTSDPAETGPSIWLGGLDTPETLETLSGWVKKWRATGGLCNALPENLSGAVLGVGPPIRLTPAKA